MSIEDKPTGNVQGRISIINVPDDISALKFRSFFKKEAADVQAKITGEGFAIIRLFLPDSIRYAIGQRKLDSLLQEVVDKHPNIYRVELIKVAKSLSVNDMQKAAADAEQDLHTIADEIEDTSIH